ncbi:S-layer homology domain-containing protein [Oscillibacter sp.]|uniref:S-layer homology domain-containing protein n=1 Tax=Oscillibacter sp. TaxID=1945593 RepID=UPI002D7ECB05|nr:S-layer homology domain-containing protein [Oscillibacter sp.]
MKRLQRVLSCLLLCALLAGMFTVPASALSDVPEDFWAKEDIDRCVTLRYFYPEADGSFGVGKEMSRAEFVVVLCRAMGWKPTSPARAVYDDVSEKAWYAGALEIAYHQGAITSQDGNFRPDDLITRSEAASMLVRALGYGSLAGLIQDMSLPFRDVKANNGYIVMAYGLGLMDGTSVTSFSPNGRVTREQAAAILMRLYDKLHDSTASRIGIAVSSEELPELKGYEAVGVAAAKLAYNGDPQIAPAMDKSEAQAVQAAASAAGARALLYVTGNDYHIREGDEEKLAAVMFQAVEEGGYDGLFLEVSGLTTVTQRDVLTAAVRSLREKLGERPLYIGAEAPSWKGAIFGYDYAALGEAADRLVLRFDYKKETAAGRTVAPLEPLEQIYYALNRLRGVVDADKLALILTSTGSVWEGREPESLTGKEITNLAAERTTRSHYSDRYACAYLVRETGPDVWYLNGQAIKERTQLARLFGGGHLCLSDLNHALPETLAAMP